LEDAFVDWLRGGLISAGGTLPIIAPAVLILAIAAYCAYRFKDNAKFAAILCCVIAVAAIVYASAGYPVAVSSCESLANSDFFGAYQHDNCETIVHCTPPSSTAFGRFSARCTARPFFN
jgi:hypothetical protein